jgi:hypothetical protein
MVWGQHDHAVCCIRLSVHAMHASSIQPDDVSHQISDELLVRVKVHNGRTYLLRPLINFNRHRAAVENLKFKI